MTGQVDLLDVEEVRASFMETVAVAHSEDCRAVIDTILAHVAPGEQFSANTIRKHLPPGVDRNSIGPTFGKLKRAGVIIPCGLELSSQRTTRAEINRYVLVHPSKVTSPGRITVRAEGRGEGLRWVASWPDQHNPGKRVRLDAGTRAALDPVLPVIARQLGLPIVVEETS